MAFMERLQSTLILQTSLYHPQEAHLIEHPEHAFYQCIKQAQYEQLEQMILEGFSVDFQECAHTPPLIYAIMLKEYRAVELLLRYGASPNICNTHRQTPLHIALYHRLHEVIHLLLRYGARIESRDHDDITPMHLAELLDDAQSITNDNHALFVSVQLNHDVDYRTGAIASFHIHWIQEQDPATNNPAWKLYYKVIP